MNVVRSRAIVALGTFLASLAFPAGGVAAAPPRDADLFDQQWNLRAIHADDAWAAGALGSAAVSVAVLDTGIDTQHPDLAGIVDLERSKSFLNKSNKCRPGEPGDPSPRDEDREAQLLGLHRVTDFHSHGTGVAGLISSNAIHLAGVTQQTTLFGVKVHDKGRRNCLSVYLEAVQYAADNGADVIHLSFPLEFTRTDFPGSFDQDVARVDEAMAYAHRRGAVLVAAAGNNAQDLDATPDRFRFCMADYVVCVSATGTASIATIRYPEWDAPASYTNFGTPIDVAGPGGTTAVPVWLTCSTVTRFTGAPQKPCRDGELVWRSTGTSFGAAATSGVLALLVAKIGPDRPDEVVAALRATSDNIPGGNPDYYGDGRINAANAVAFPLP